MFGYKENVILIVCCLNLNQFIVFSQINRNDTRFSYMVIFFNRCFLHDASLCCHEKINIMFKIPNRYHRSDFFSRLQLKNIHNSCSPGYSGGFRNLISLNPISFAFICKEHNKMMGACHQKVLNIVIIQSGHSFNSLTAPVLAAEIINRHSFDITKLCHGNDGIFFFNQIFDGDFIIINADRCSPVIAVFITNHGNLITNHAEKTLFIAENCLQLGNFCFQIRIFCFQFFSFQTSQSAQTHIDNRLGLNICQSKTLN